MSTSVVNLTMKFKDGKTRKMSLGPVAPSALSQVKARIISRNDPTYREENYKGFDTGFVSESGADFMEISAAEIVTTNETIIF